LRLTLVLFHDYWQVVEDGAKITAVAPLTQKSYVPQGCTALYDAIGDTMNSVGQRLDKTAPEARPNKVLVLTLGQPSACMLVPQATKR
jgi:hypothetical protein